MNPFLNGVLLVALSTTYAAPQYPTDRSHVESSQGNDFHATWIPASYDASTQDALCRQLESLQKVGFDRVYLDVWNQVSPPLRLFLSLTHRTPNTRLRTRNRHNFPRQHLARLPLTSIPPARFRT